MPSPMDQITALPRRDPSETQQPQAPNIAPHKKGGTLGSIAFLGDSLLRGFMRGKEQSEQVKVYKANRLMQGFQSAYDTAKRRMLELAKNGDTTSKEYLDAKAAADAAWQAKIQMYGNYMGADKGKGKGKKSKSGGQSDGEQENPLTMLQSKDPHEQARGWLAITKQSGPDYNSEIKQYQTPEYQQWVKTRRGEGALTQGNVEDRTELRKLEMTDTSKMSEGERTEHQKKIGALRSRISEVNTGYSQQEKKLDKRIGPDNHEQILWEKPDGTREWRDEGAVRAPVSETKPIRAWSKDAHGKAFSVEVDPKTNQIIPGTENHDIVPPADAKTLIDTIRTGEFSYKDADGKLHRAETTTTTSHVPHGGGGTASSAGTGTGAGGGSHPSASGQPKGDRVISDPVPTGQTKSRADAADTTLKLVPKVRELLKDSDVQKELGALPGRVSEAEMKIGNASPKVRELYGTLKSIYSLAGTMHGWRSLKVADEFEKAYGGLHTNPDGLLAGMDAMENTAKAMYETGYKHPWGQKSNTSGSGAGDPSKPHAVDAILDDMLKPKS